MNMLERAGMNKTIGEQNFFWSADRAILVAEHRHLNLPDPVIAGRVLPSEEPSLTAMPI
jgi:SulP family sulfate permease